MKKQHTSLKWKIFKYLLAFCGVLLVVLWLYQIVFLDRFYRFVKIGEVRSSAIAIADNLERTDFAQYLAQLAAERQVGVEVVTVSGNSRYTAGTIQESILPIMSNLEKVRLLQQAAENNGEIMVYYNRENFRESRQTGPMVHGRMAWLGQASQSMILYARLVGDESGWQTAILISSRVAPVAATVNTLRIQFYYIAAFLLVLAVLLALTLARRVASPIETITKRARTLAAGDYTANFSGGGYREIDELADTLNYAAVELSRVEHLRRELIANVSHDLRTPLTLISGYAEAMMDLPGEASPENARVIAEETRRLSGLVNDMLDISRLESGKQPVRRKPYNLTRSLAEMVRRLQLLVSKDGYTLAFHAEDEVTVNADKELISQAFYNLLINGIHYTGADGKVTVEQRVHDGLVTVTVKDSGPGIDPDHLPHIWDRYYKGAESHRRSVAGTGLGLAIVRWVMDEHNADYGVESGKDTGSAFWFTLPVVAGSEEEENS